MNKSMIPTPHNQARAEICSTYDDQNDAFDRLTRALANLSLHSQRLSRQFDKTLAELRNLQKTRLKSETGFVFTDAPKQPMYRTSAACEGGDPLVATTQIRGTVLSSPDQMLPFV